MKKHQRIIWGALSVMLTAGLFSWWLYAQENSCDEMEFTFTDDFSTIEWKDPGSSVYWPGNGEITLNKLGANFEITEPDGMGGQIYVCDSGDFTGNGLPDLVGLDISGVPRLVLVRNEFEDSTGDGYDDDGVIFRIDENYVFDTGFYSSGEWSGPAAVTVGDYNGDGLLDFLFMKNNEDNFGDNEFFAVMYINVGTAEEPRFEPHTSSANLDFTDRFLEKGIYCNWAANHMDSVDIDEDGDLDVLVISKDQVFLLRNPGSDEFSLENWEISELNYDQKTGFTRGVGGSAIAPADLDNDGDIDIICGTAEDYNYIVYYENDGTEYFTRRDIPIPEDNATGPVVLLAADFDHNGYPDIFGSTDRWRDGKEARMWIYRNKGMVGEGEDRDLELQFHCMMDCQPILPHPHDTDMGTALDYDGDGDLDIIVADANHSENYYLVINQLADVYTLHGEARSKVVTPDLDPATQAVTRVRLEGLDQSVRGGSSEGLKVTLYVSSNGGRNWEFLAEFNDDEIGNINPGDQDWHYFVHFGSHLKWKAVLTAEEDEMEEFDLASKETPVLSSIQLRYAVVDRREYSRSSVAVRVVDDDNQPVKLIIGGSFYFPGWQGHLRAYDVTDMEMINSSHSELRTVTRPDFSEPEGRELADNVTIRWDAGELLDSRSAGSRVIYTALPDEEEQLQRIDFSTANLDQLAPELNDFQNDNTGLIDFVRGENRDWKLGDINHSNPVIVGPPEGDPNLKGPGYETFALDHQDRDKVLIVGANDGMIHCFDVLTGEERWAFIPYNLLPKLRNMWLVDEATEERYFARDVYVDGSPVVEDVLLSGEWKTVLISGQGPGRGSGRGVSGATGNFYFALDITDIDNPQVLWEFSDSKMGETWSVPVIGKIRKEGQDTWTAFMGSGYDNVPGQDVQGNRFYAVDIAAGEAFWSFDSEPEVNTADIWENGANVPVAFPGSPNSIDADKDGYTDSVYIGDLEGRFWKIDVGLDFQLSSPWEEEKIYEDSRNYPIITKPEVWKDPASASSYPRVYFGTGGDDKAPDTAVYSFIAMTDGLTQEVEWFLGDPDTLGLPAEKQTGTFEPGEKVWADPKIANTIVYFSTLEGNIETVDPCSNLAGMGRLYARHVKPISGAALGATAFKSSTGPMENMTLEIKTRAAVTLGESERAGGVRKREVYIQEYDSTIQKMEQPSGALLKVKSWREIFKIIK
ncbi:MAG: PilC/PilY family type IV pilus protein [Candidatus Aminicenantes bacterium]